mmetsp:Transcript_15140/g.47060  ORF Transcript_15140/g.47060 Transcript_15140/m.47060 type:complete len:396 (-) Transcript_15140:195-1382(-)
MGAVASSEVSSLQNYASVQVAVEKTTYQAGETVRGYVQLAVAQTTTMTSVTASLAGTARTTVRLRTGTKLRRRSRSTAPAQVHYTTHRNKKTRHHTAREHRCLLQMEAAVARFPSGSCDPGHFQCPFEFLLPTECPSTLARRGGGRNTASLDYCVGVVVARPGWTKRNLVHRVAIDVVAAPPPVVSPARVDETVRVTRCCCIDAGVMRLGALMAQNAYQDGQNLEIHYAVANNSSQLIVGVRCSLQQILTVSARGRSHRMISELASVVMPGVHRGGSVGIKGTPLATAPLWLPKFSPTTGALFSRVTPTIIVSHRVVVQTKTKSDYVQDPFIKLPVTLYTLNPPPAATLVAAPVDGGSDGLVPVAAPLPYAPQASSAAPARGVPVDTTGDGVADS